MSVSVPVRRIGLILLFSAQLLAQKTNTSTTTQPAPPTAAAAQPAQQLSAQDDGELSQMRDDLNRMESLNMNMSSEIEFLHDQNLQILLRTNSQMWTILIRDLRKQLAREEQRRTAPPPASKK